MVRPEIGLHIRALLIAIGLYAVAALVWFAGPLLSLGELAPLASARARWLAIGALIGLFVAHALWRTLRTARRNRKLMDGLGTADAAAPGAPEVAIIGKRFAEAMSLLRSRRVGGKKNGWASLRRRPFVYELPWYILIGAPGAGKTTTIVNSGLDFPFSAQLGPKALRGAGGTRNCDWWFSSEAVLIDTAGRYTTQDSYREADRAAWTGFLKLLVQHRPRQPINGAILTLSVTDLLQPNADKRRTLAREMRERIEELHQHLGIRFPIYVLVTKSDLLAGFAEFFADFDKDERAQVWGSTFALDAERDAPAMVARLGNELTALEKTLNECLIERLRDERDRDRRSALFGFPQQWRVMRESLLEMVQATFVASPGAATPLLRGVYFTSATQEGSPMDRAIGGLARSLGLANRVLPSARPSGRSYFVTRLLREVIIGEAGLAGTNRRWERRRSLMHAGVVAGTGLVTAATLAWAWHQYRDNLALLASTRAAVYALKPQAAAVQAAAATDLASMVPLLNSVAALQAQVAPAAGGAPRRLAMGLDQSAPLAAVTQDVYHHLLRESLLPRIALRLEQRLAAGQPEQVQAIYEALRAYLMLFGGKNFDAASLRAFLNADWEASLAPALGAGTRQALRQHLDQLLATGEVGAPALADAALVERSRALVASVPLAQRVYIRLQQTEIGESASAFSFEFAGGPAASKLLTRASGLPMTSAVPALYSLALRQQGVRNRVQEVLRQFDDEAPWVMQAVAGTQAAATGADDAQRLRLVHEVEALYAADYLRAWSQMVGDLRLLPVKTLAASAEQAQILSRPDSPLLAILSAVLRELGVAQSPAVGNPAAQGVRPARVAGVDEHFAALRAYVLGQPAGFEPVHAALGRLATQLTAIDDAVLRKTALPAIDAIGEVAALASRVPEPVRALLIQAADQSRALVFSALREPLGRQLASQVTPLCARAVEGRYPLVRSSTQEITREEFAQTFASGGAIDAFFQRHLSDFVDTAGRQWAYRAGLDAQPGHAADALLPFQRAQAIRSAFFRDGGRTFGVRLEFKLVELDPGIGQFLIDVDGQTLRFARDSRAAQVLQWPGPGGAGRVSLQAPAPGAAPGAGFVFEGPWSLLRMLERVRVEPGASANQATLSFDVEGRKARFEVRGSNAALPITLPELEQFQCPKRL